MEGYGPYKPVPPPKPLPQQPTLPQPQPRGCFTPPPYKMPPYPIYNEPSIPGTTGLESATSTCSLTTPQSLRTHSSKFPVWKTNYIFITTLLKTISAERNRKNNIKLLNNFITVLMPTTYMLKFYWKGTVIFYNEIKLKRRINIEK